MSLDITLYCNIDTGAEPRKTGVFELNITHNLGEMADECGLYEPMWRPDELGITQAGDLIEVLSVGVKALESDPERFKAFNPENGWGTYDLLLNAARRYLKACKEYPKAEIHTWR